MSTDHNLQEKGLIEFNIFITQTLLKLARLFFSKEMNDSLEKKRTVNCVDETINRNSDNRSQRWPIKVQDNLSAC